MSATENMSQVEVALKDILLEQGRSVVGDPARLESQLSRSAPQASQEVAAVMAAVAEGVPAAFRRPDPPSPADCAAMLTRMMTRTGLKPELASWAFNIWWGLLNGRTTQSPAQFGALTAPVPMPATVMPAVNPGAAPVTAQQMPLISTPPVPAPASSNAVVSAPAAPTPRLKSFESMGNEWWRWVLALILVSLGGSMAFGGVSWFWGFLLFAIGIYLAPLSIPFLSGKAPRTRKTQ